jgi:hypothetical protein
MRKQREEGKKRAVRATKARKTQQKLAVNRMLPASSTKEWLLGSWSTVWIGGKPPNTNVKTMSLRHSHVIPIPALIPAPPNVATTPVCR